MIPLPDGANRRETMTEQQSLDNPLDPNAPLDPAADTVFVDGLSGSEPSTEAVGDTPAIEAEPFQGVTDDLDALLGTLPLELRGAIEAASRDRGDGDHVADPVSGSALLEIVLDLGRAPSARFIDGETQLSDSIIEREDLDTVVSRLGEFGDDNRAGLNGTLHRISSIRNRHGDVVGLTMRVGRAVYGTVKVIEDLVNSGRSILLLGRPGVGKTTMLREMARVLSEAGQRVIVVDTSNEIAGDGDVPHPGIGRARRMQVRTPSEQHAVMVEAVENHMPEVIVIDEIGTELEAQAARTIAERGVQLVATAHGNTLGNLMMNPTLADLIGGIQTVTLSDEEARRRGTRKSVLERKAPPTFGILVEIQSFSRVSIHNDVALTVDALLRGEAVRPAVRELDGGGSVQIEDGESARTPLPFQQSFQQAFEQHSRGGRDRLRDEDDEATPPSPGPHRRIFPFGASPSRLSEAIGETGANASVVSKIEDADAVMTLRSIFRRKPAALRAAESSGLPIYVLKHNTVTQMGQSLRALMRGRSEQDQVTSALAETEEAIAQLQEGAQDAVELAPQNAYIRRLQHQLAQRMDVFSNSKGREPYRRVRVFRT